MPEQNTNQLNQARPTPPKVSSAKHLWPALAALVLVMVVGSAFAVLYPRRTQAPSPKSVVKDEIATPTTTPSTADWKTYRNEEYGFEIKYPLELIAQSPPSGLKKIATFNQTALNFEGDQPAAITVSLIISDIGAEIGRIQAEIESNLNIENIKISDIPATKITGILNGNVFAWGGKEHGFVLFIHNGSKFVIDYDSTTPLIEKNINQILSTFKFID